MMVDLFEIEDLLFAVQFFLLNLLAKDTARQKDPLPPPKTKNPPQNAGSFVDLTLNSLRLLRLSICSYDPVLLTN